MKTDSEKIGIIEYWSVWFDAHVNDNDCKTQVLLADLYAAIARDLKIAISFESTMYKLMKECGVPNTSEVWNYIMLYEGRDKKHVLD